MNLLRSFSRPQRGFTLVELLAVMAIFGFVTVATIKLYPNSSVRLKVSNIASELQGDLRQAQLSASSVNSQRQTVAGYGIHFPVASKDMYQPFVDKVTTTEVNGLFIGNQKYDGADENTDNGVTFPTGYAVTELCVNQLTVDKPFITCRSNAGVTDVTILYKRPSAQPIIYINNSTTTLYSAACIQIENESSRKGAGSTRNVVVTKTGLIDVGLGGCLDGNAGPSAPPPSPTASTIDVSSYGSNLVDVAADRFGNAYTASFTSKKVAKINAAGAASLYGALGATPAALTLDTSGTLYVLASGIGNVPTIIKFVPNGSAPAISSLPAPATTVLSASGIITDSSGFIYVLDDTSNKVWKIDPVAGSATIFGSTGNNPIAITADPSDNIYVLNHDTVTKLDPSGTSLWNVSTVSAGINSVALSVDSSGNVYVANDNNSVTKITSTGISLLNFSTTGMVPVDITTDSLGNIYSANVAPKNISKILPGGPSAPLANTGDNPMAIASNGTIIYVANQGGTVTKVTQ